MQEELLSVLLFLDIMSVAGHNMARTSLASAN